MAKKREFYGWTLVGAVFLLDFLLMGLPYYSVINTYMLKQVHMSRSTYGWGFTLTNLFYGLPSTLVAVTIIRWGLKVTFGIGAALILAGTIWLGFFATQPWHYLVGFGVLIGTGFCFSTNVPISTAITRWFRRYRGRAMAISLSGAGVGGFLGAPLVNRFLAANGGNWRQAWHIMSTTVVLAGIVAILYVKERPEVLGQVADGLVGEATTGPSLGAKSLVTDYAWTPAEAYRTLPFWMIVIGGIACKYPLFFMLGHWLLHLKEVGISPANAATALGLFTLTQIPGQLIGGWLMDKIVARYALMLGFCCYLLATVLAIRLTGHSVLMADAAATFFGIGFGWTFIAVYTVVGHYYGPVAYPKLTGMMALLSTVIAAPSSAIAGKLFDIYGHYAPALELVGLLSCVGVAALAFATMPRPSPGQRARRLVPAEALQDDDL
jgi:MFS family permease